MQKGFILSAVVSLLFFGMSSICAYGEDSSQSENVDLNREVGDSINRVDSLEKKIGQSETKESRFLQSAISALEITGGISAGFFSASNPGQDESDNEFLLSNFLVELSPKDKTLPVGFVGAFGEISTPSLLDTPKNNNNFDIEYGSLILRPITGVSLETGLLLPNAGFEDSYTYNNRNITLGVIASQQPYNAYGARMGYDFNGLYLCAGYYKQRLNDQEYVVNGSSAPDSWEIGLSGSVFDSNVSIYHYHLEGLRNLTGAAVEYTIKNIYIAFNIDYWVWGSSMKSAHASESSIGGAIYVCPSFGKFSIPLRLEYIDQGESKIYIESTNAKHIYTATISPTYHILDNAYIRAEFSYVKADSAFADKSGNLENERIYLAAEVGYLF
jgi:Putative beta-barrel porin-2, OmpL-like. bbp2